MGIHFRCPEKLHSPDLIHSEFTRIVAVKSHLHTNFAKANTKISKSGNYTTSAPRPHTKGDMLMSGRIAALNSDDQL